MTKPTKTLGGARSLKSSQKFGFTLAEVLITLAVIGVVAALTIPVVVHKYQQKQMYTAFMKTYNTLTNVMDLSIADNGSPNGWDYSNDGSKVLETYIGPYLKASKFCEDENDNCYVSEISYLDGETDDNPEVYPMYVLSDGSIIADFSICEEDGLLFIVDTNGKKGPNVVGRDIFYLNYDEKKGSIVGEEYTIAGSGQSSSGSSSGSGSNDSNCDPSVNGKQQGLGCASRLLQEGQMSY